MELRNDWCTIIGVVLMNQVLPRASVRSTSPTEPEVDNRGKEPNSTPAIVDKDYDPEPTELSQKVLTESEVNEAASSLSGDSTEEPAAILDSNLATNQDPPLTPEETMDAPDTEAAPEGAEES